MPQATEVYSVSELTGYLKHLLESDAILSQAQVAGEVSNLTYHRSGHVYFTLKDGQSQLSCVMFKGYAQYAPKMQVGDQVIAKGGISVYAPRGNYQLMVKSIRKQGLGDLYQRFVELKNQLEKEGLFSPERKKSPPELPEHIIVITSPTGAAIRDILQTIRRRYNRGKVTILPTIVQGQGGASSIVQNLRKANLLDADLILLARGGGSLEDLWNFNEESVARAIAASKLPVISGIGHESDFTIADFVVDRRASTPTAAAEMAVPNLGTVAQTLQQYERQLYQQLQYFIDFKRQILDDYSYRGQQAMRQFLQKKQHELALLASQLESHDRSALLARGYSITLHQGRIVNDPETIQTGDSLETVLFSGRINSTVD